MSQTTPPSECSESNLSQGPMESIRPRVTSFFEFWPTWLMYLPVAVMWLLLALRYRSLTLPLIANPRIHLAGMVGSSKTEVLAQAQGVCADAILPWVLLIRSQDSIDTQVSQILADAKLKGISFPLVCKPDLGCRGAGVKLVHDPQSLAEIINQYPVGAGLIIQKLSSFENEVGIFFVRDPRAENGRIVSLTFKERPTMVGDGVSTLEQLVMKNPRASQLYPLYASRNKEHWHVILAKDQRHSLLFSASHCRGAVFTDGREHISPELEQTLNHIMRELPGFHYGRLDVKYNNLAELKAGASLQIVEINGASAEAIHIWDKDTRFLNAIGTLLWQYRTLFRLGNTIRKRGIKTPTLKSILTAWRREIKLTAHYPETD
ncbi:D-alanine--D-alanine ligase [Dasania marina]|uniref:D-alanine--D-alanine ligase n=1 Tax=Dasania marina TaxID=471499 RepID=UPI0030D9198F